MNRTLTIARREWAALFFSPIAYVVFDIFALFAGLIFTLGVFRPGQVATLRDVFFWIVWILIFLVPALTMRVISDEFRHGTVELLMTAPIHDGQVILGKWLGVMGFIAAMLLPLVIFGVVLSFSARPDWGPILTGLLGLLLIGAFFSAIGIFASAASQNQIIAFLLAVAIISVFTFVTFFLGASALVSDTVRQVLNYANVSVQFDQFNKGLIDLPSLLYFLSGSVLFLFLATLLLQSRRWR